jgi:hypothetical protein
MPSDSAALRSPEQQQTREPEPAHVAIYLWLSASARNATAPVSGGAAVIDSPDSNGSSS